MGSKSSTIPPPSISNNVGATFGDGLEMAPGDMLREIGSHGRTKSVIDRAAKLTGLKYWRVYDIIYNKVRHIEAHEIDRITQVLRAQRETRSQIRNLEYRIARLERILDRRNAPLAGSQADLFGDVVHSGG